MRRLVLMFVPPLVAVALMLGVFAAAARTSAVPLFAYDTWIKWDSGHYLTIANDGYEFMSCAELTGYDPNQWCGNSGWFPGYPFLIRALQALTGQPTILLAVVVSQFFTAVSLGVVWNLFLDRRHIAALALAAFAPGTYYFLVGFPVSMVMAFTLVALSAWKRGRHGVALVAGGLAGFTYPSVVWLTAVFGTELLVRLWRRERPAMGTWLAALGPAVGFGAVLTLHLAVTGRWNAFFLTQEKYGHGLYFPLSVLWSRAVVVWELQPVWWEIGLQSLLAATLVLCAIAAIARAARHARSQRGDLVLALYTVTFWLVPLVLGRVSPYRAESLLAPAVAATARLSGGVQLAVLAPAILIWFLMAMQFVQGKLV